MWNVNIESSLLETKTSYTSDEFFSLLNHRSGKTSPKAVVIGYLFNEDPAIT